jgi:hypothetical protein
MCVCIYYIYIYIYVYVFVCVCVCIYIYIRSRGGHGSAVECSALKLLVYEALSCTGVFVSGRGVDSALRLNARRALTLMDRFPVSDDVTYSIEEEEGLIDDDTVALS